MKYITLAFQVSDEYDERELENLFEAFESRGSILERWAGPCYRVYIPDGMDWGPFFNALVASRSIGHVHPVPVTHLQPPTE